MTGLRCRLASGALALIALQLGLLFAAPLSACCRKSAAPQTAATASDEAPDCCPPGAHPKGDCPLHRSRAAHCRMTCGRTSGPEFLLGTIGVLPATSAAVVPFAESAAPIAAAVVVPFRSSVPDAPPPRFL